MKPYTSHRVDLRGLEHRVLTWGPADAPKLFMVHGWMDVAASFQFLVDALQGEWQVVAPDLRGFGGSAWQPQGYWFPDYVADLEALLDHYSPDEPVTLVGHSLGGNVAMLYAGIRPERVARLVSLDAFGLPKQDARAARAKYRKWLDALRSPPTFQPYADLGAVAARLRKTNPRLSAEKAAFLAGEWAEELPDGTARLCSDPRHKLPFPFVSRMEEWNVIWRAIAAPTLWIAAEESWILRKWLGEQLEGESFAMSLAALRRRLAEIPGATLVTIPDAGHMLHHDQPEAVARAIEAFLRA